MNSALKYDITSALKRSPGFHGLINVLSEDLSRDLCALIQITEDKDGAVLYSVLSGGASNDDLYKTRERADLPLMLSYKRAGELRLYRPSAFEQDELEYARLISSYLTLVFLGIDSGRMGASDIKAALSTLSYSELEAVIGTVSELPGTQGLIVASKIAKEHSLSRSGLINGLRKLESAGLIETRSLGMKGTYIKVLEQGLLAELNKFDHRRL